MPKIKYLLLGISVFFPLSACRCGGTVSSQPSHASLQPSGWAAGAEQGDYAPATQPEGSASATQPDGSASASPSGRAAGAESGSSQPSGRAAGAEQGDYAPATRPEGSAATRPEGSADNRPEGSAARQASYDVNIVFAQKFMVKKIVILISAKRNTGGVPAIKSKNRLYGTVFDGFIQQIRINLHIFFARFNLKINKFHKNIIP